MRLCFRLSAEAAPTKAALEECYGENPQKPNQLSGYSNQKSTGSWLFLRNWQEIVLGQVRLLTISCEFTHEQAFHRLRKQNELAIPGNVVMTEEKSQPESRILNVEDGKTRKDWLVLSAQH